MMCRGSSRSGVLLAVLAAACSTERGPAAERDGIEDSGTTVDAAPKAAALADAAPGATIPECGDKTLASGPLFVIAAGSELLTHGGSSLGSEVEETWLHGTVMEVGSGIPDGLDPTMVGIRARDTKGWRFIRIANDAGAPWTVLAQHLDVELSFGVDADMRVDVRLRYDTPTFAPMLLELELLQNTVPVFYYANAGDRMKLLPPRGLGISLGEIECTQPAECFKNLDFHSLRVEVPDHLPTTIVNGESAQVGDYVLKHYGTVMAEASICMDAVADHIELAVSRSL